MSKPGETGYGVIQRNSICFADLALLLLCLAGVYQLWIKADLPFHLSNYDSRLIVDETGGLENIRAGDHITGINGIRVSSRDEIETITDGLIIGQVIPVSILRNGIPAEASCRLIRFYSLFYILTVLFSGIAFFAVAVFVLFKSGREAAAYAFHWVVIGTGIIIMTTWGSYALMPALSVFILRFLFHMAYMVVPVIFLHFTLVFPKENFPALQNHLKLPYSTAILLAMAIQTSFILFAYERSAQLLDFYTAIFTAGRILMAACVAAGIIIFILSYRRAGTDTEKKKIKWILFSLIAGPGSFIVLWVIPQAFGNYVLIPEEAVIILMVLVPAGFSFAIVKHHIFNIDRIISRSLAYSILLTGIIIIYLTAVYLLSHLFDQPESPAAYVLITAFVAFIFAPLKSRIQNLVDKKFFRIRYNFRTASLRLLDGIRNTDDLMALSSKISSELDAIIPAEKMGVYLAGDNGFEFTAGHGFDLKHAIKIHNRRLNVFNDEILGLAEYAEAGIRVKDFMRNFLIKEKLCFILPIRNSENTITGFIAMGRKRSGRLYTIEDAGLLNSVCIEAGLKLEKIYLAASLIRKELEKEKLLELNELKSFFLSAVTHDLKSPITSIRMFSELMQSGSGTLPRGNEDYPKIITGECDRLTRLIDNILDLTKIEKGIKEYNFRNCSLNEAASYALTAMDYQFRIAKCCIETNFLPEECTVIADRDSIISAVMNLLSNALKYSQPPARITLSVLKSDGFSGIKVTNNAPHFSDEELKHLSELYFRTDSSKRSHTEGSGLGLYLVKQIIEAHKGTLKICNEHDYGCSFTILLPDRGKDEENINN